MKMSKSEFVRLSVLSNYGTQSEAEDYVKENPKDIYTIDDFIKLYHENQVEYCNGYHKGLVEAYGINGRTTAMHNGIRGNNSASQDWGY